MPAAGPGDFLALGELIEPLQTGQNANGVCIPPAVVIRGGLLWEATGSSDLPPGDRMGSRGMRVASTFRWRHPGACNQDWEDVGGGAQRLAAPYSLEATGRLQDQTSGLEIPVLPFKRGH